MNLCERWSVSLKEHKDRLPLKEGKVVFLLSQLVSDQHAVCGRSSTPDHERAFTCQQRFSDWLTFMWIRNFCSHCACLRNHEASQVSVHGLFAQKRPLLSCSVPRPWPAPRTIMHCTCGVTSRLPWAMTPPTVMDVHIMGCLMRPSTPKMSWI